jgi:hypothetical protein
MYFCGDIHMAIFYWIIKQQDKGLALTIRDYKERYIHIQWFLYVSTNN